MESKQASYTVVVGVDFTAASDVALRQAVRLVRGQEDAELHVVHVIAERDGAARKANHFAMDARLLASMPSELRGYVAERMEGAPPRNIALHVRLGDPARAIRQLAVDVDADLIVVGMHAQKGIEKLLLGSVAQDLIKTACCPLLVARPKDYTGLEHSPEIQPACPECVKARKASGGASWWCGSHRSEAPSESEFHSEPYFSGSLHGTEAPTGYRIV